MSRYSRKKAKGAILPIVGLTLAVLLGMAGLVIDLGGLFVAKTELQSALDGCALGAAQELDGLSNSVQRATNAGLTAGNANKVRYQKLSASIAASDIKFSDTLNGSFSSTFDPVSAKYARCTLALNGITAYLIQMVGGASSNGVAAVAVATRAHAQSVCALPLGLVMKNGTPPNYGYSAGEWVKMRYNNSADPTALPGEMGWFNLNPDKGHSSAETASEMQYGYCGSQVGQDVGTGGHQASVNDVWNSRFGIYKKTEAMKELTPDYTGYAYTSTNWPAKASAYDGPTPTCSPACPTAANFLAKRGNYANYADTGTSVKQGEKITDQKLTGGYDVLATSGNGGNHYAYGSNRRLVNVPVISSAGKIQDYACMLMLHPAENSTKEAYLEYRGNAGQTNSPCLGNGLAGGTTGPLVPVLVQ